MPKIAIITALCGGREALVNPVVIHPNVDYIAFVDQEWPEATIWNKFPIHNFSTDVKYAGRRNAKQYKVIPHIYLPDYEYYFWADVSHDVVMDPREVITQYLYDSDIALFKHTARNCVYQEAAILKELGYDYPELIDAQINRYRLENYPENAGLWELPVSVRRNTEATRKLNELWWSEIENNSSRDQLSMPYCLWKRGIIPAVLPGFANGNGGFNANSIIPQTRRHVSSGG